MTQTDSAFPGMQPAVYISVLLPDGTQLLKGGMGFFIGTALIITCGPFSRSALPVKGRQNYIILFHDSAMRPYYYHQCMCISASRESSFRLGKQRQIIKPQAANKE